MLTAVPQPKPAPHDAASPRVSGRILRVGFVMHKMQTAGAEMLVAATIRELAGEITPTIFCLDAVGDLGEQLQDEGVDVVAFDRRPGIDRSLPGKLKVACLERSIDVLHAHQYTPFFYAALARVAGLKQTPIIFTEHGRHYPDVVGWKRRWANRLLLSRFATVSTACCQFAADAIETKEGLGRRKVQVLPNGIDTDRFKPRDAERDNLRGRLGLKVDRKYVSCVARFHSVKDHATLLRSFAIVAEQDTQTDLLLVGDGPLRSNLENLSKELNLEDRIQFWGVRRDVADILTASDLFVLPSRSEAASLTLLEAMACECPVVVTDVGGNPEIVRHGVEGLLTPRGDANAMADAVLQLLADGNSRELIGEAARRRVLNDYQQRDTVAAYRDLYHQVARAPRS